MKVERITPASPSRDAVDEVRSGGRSHQNTWVPTDDKLGIHQDSSDRYNQYAVKETCGLYCGISIYCNWKEEQWGG